jgi:hypothetical protein
LSGFPRKDRHEEARRGVTVTAPAITGRAGDLVALRVFLVNRDGDGLFLSLAVLFPRLMFITKDCCPQRAVPLPFALAKSGRKFLLWS